MTVSLDYLGEKKFKAHAVRYSYLMNCNEITPVEYFATGLIGCTAYDLAAFAENAGFEVKNYSVEAEIGRRTEPPVKFESLHIIYRFDGVFDPLLAKRWILSSLESYCTTVNSIRDSVKISYTIIYNGQPLAEEESILSGGGSSSGDLPLDDGFGAPVCCPG
jgi:putative redox protein